MGGVLGIDLKSTEIEMGSNGPVGFFELGCCLVQIMYSGRRLPGGKIKSLEQNPSYPERKTTAFGSAEIETRRFGPLWAPWIKQSLAHSAQ